MHNHNNKDAAAAAKRVRADIPLLQTNAMHYLDNAATALMPQAVINAATNYDNQTRANIGRGLHKFAGFADEHYNNARAVVASMLNADTDEIIFTSGTTAGLNLLAAAIGQTLTPKDAVVLSIAEHHSNIVPWHIAAKRQGFDLRFADIDKRGAINLDDLGKQNNDGRAKVFSLTHASNVSGAINNIAKLTQTAKQHNNNAIVIIDGAQQMPHCYAPMPVANTGADFYLFSAHKCYAANGIGVLWGKKNMLANLPAVIGGGGAVASVREDGYDLADLPRRLEAGTPPITQAIALAAAMQWMQNIPKAARQHENDLAKHARRELKKIKGVRVLFDNDDDDNNTNNRAPIISFTMDNIHPHDCCQILSANNIAVRGGNLCAEPLMRRLSINGCIRASIAPYNTADDINAMIDGVNQTQKQLA